MQNSQRVAPLCTQVDIGPMTSAGLPTAPPVANGEVTQLLRDILSAQDRNNAILEQMLEHFTLRQKQRRSELSRWQDAYPQLTGQCRSAAEALGKVQNEFLGTLASEVNSNYEDMMDGEFVLSEFIDRFGPRMAHISGILQMLSHLGSPGDSAS